MNSDLMKYNDPDGLAFYIMSLTVKRLCELGFREYTATIDGKPVLLLLCPFEWYFLLPDKTPIRYVNGNITVFKYGRTDSSEIHGSLGFEIYVNPKKIIFPN